MPLHKLDAATLERLRYAVGGAHGVALGDLGVWEGGGLLWAGFFDPSAWRPRSFAAVVGALSWWEAEAVAA